MGQSLIRSVKGRLRLCLIGEGLRPRCWFAGAGVFGLADMLRACVKADVERLKHLAPQTGRVFQEERSAHCDEPVLWRALNEEGRFPAHHTRILTH